MLPLWYSVHADELVQEGSREEPPVAVLSTPSVPMTPADAETIREHLDETLRLLGATRMAVDALLGMYGTLQASHYSMLRNHYNDIFSTRNIISDLLTRAGHKMQSVFDHPALAARRFPEKAQLKKILGADFLMLSEDRWHDVLRSCNWAVISIRERVEAATGDGEATMSKASTESVTLPE